MPDCVDRYTLYPMTELEVSDHERVTDGDAATALPLNDTCWGLDAPLSASEMAPVRVPLVVGVKVTEIVQLAPPSNSVPQLLVSAKSPLTLTLAKERLALPVFVSVTLFAEPVEFRA